MIGYDDTYKRILPYRIDRMPKVEILYNEPRDGEEKFKRMGISDYARQTFGMFIGEEAQRITIRFDSKMKLFSSGEQSDSNSSSRALSGEFETTTITQALLRERFFYIWGMVK